MRVAQIPEAGNSVLLIAVNLPVARSKPNFKLHCHRVTFLQTFCLADVRLDGQNVLVVLGKSEVVHLPADARSNGIMPQP